MVFSNAWTQDAELLFDGDTEKIVPYYMTEAILLLFQMVSEIMWYSGVPILIFLAALQTALLLQFWSMLNL